MLTVLTALLLIIPHSIASKIFITIGFLCAAVWIVKGTKIGPVILVVNRKRGWGVHTGDFMALIPLSLAVAVWII